MRTDTHTHTLMQIETPLALKTSAALIQCVRLHSHEQQLIETAYLLLLLADLSSTNTLFEAIFTLY